MAYFSTDPGGLGEFGCGADCSCKSCRSASNVGEVYEKEEIPSPAPATPPTTPKMGGWFGQPPVPRARVSAMPAQLRMPPFEVLTGYPPGQWRLSPAQLARIQRLAEHIVRTSTITSPVSRVRVIGFAEPAEAPAGLQRAVAARAALRDAIGRLNPSIIRAIQFSAEEGPSVPDSAGASRRVDIFLWIGRRTPFAPPVRILRPTAIARRLYTSQWLGEPKAKVRTIAVRAEFVIRTTTVAYTNGEPFKDGDIRIIIWEGAGNRILWPPEKQRHYISASKVGGVISSPTLSGIESDEIAIMALVRFGGADGRMHQITGLFPLPASDEFKLRVYVDLKAASVVVTAANIDAITRDPRKARAKLAKEAKIIDAMIRSGTTVRPLDEKAAKGGAGKFQVELEHYTGTLGFDPRPKQILGRQ
jgi:hypothetical protein